MCFFGFLFDWLMWFFFLQHRSFLLWSVIYLFLEENCCLWLDLWITFLALTEEEEEIEMLLENYLQRYSYHFQQTLCFFCFLNVFLAGSHYHFIVHSFRCESCHGQAERLLDSAREMEDSIAVNLRSVCCHQLSSRDAVFSLSLMTLLLSCSWWYIHLWELLASRIDLNIKINAPIRVQ